MMQVRSTPHSWPHSAPSAVEVWQLSDTHLFAAEDSTMVGCCTAHTLATVVEHLQQQPHRATALLLTGDLSQDETPASYHRLQTLVTALGVRAHWIPGNHDDPAVMAASFTHPLLNAAKAFSLGGWRLVLLSTQQPGQVTGRLSPESLHWLAQELANHAAQPTLVALHHPPCPIQSAWMDALGLENAADFYAVIDAHPQVKGVTFGHIHQEFSTMRRGVSYWGAPSTCIQFVPRRATMVLDSQAPGWRRFRLFADGHIETAVVRAGTT